MIRLLAGLRYLLASRLCFDSNLPVLTGRIVICLMPRDAYTLGCFDHLVADDCFLVAIVDSLLVVSCETALAFFSSETALVLRAILLCSSLVLLNVFIILLGCCPFAIVFRVVVVSSFHDSIPRCDSCLLVRQDEPLESMIIISQGSKPGRGIEGLECLVNMLLSSYASIVLKCDCVERSDCYSNRENVL